MKNIRFLKWLRNLSLAKKLYFVAGIMTVLVALEIFTLSFMINTLTSTRALVGAEGLWSKAEKDAVYSLAKYSYTHNESDYQQYLKLLAVPMGDRSARLELLKANPNLDLVRKAFLAGHIKPEDIDDCIKLLTRFHNISYINSAIAIWTQRDYFLDMLSDLGSKLHSQVISGNASKAEINQTQSAIYQMNDQLSVLEDNFSFTLGEGSRWIKRVILEIVFSTSVTIELLCILLIILVSRSISRGTKEMARVSKMIAKANFSGRATVFSNDEIGKLTGSFNNMIGDLQQKMEEEKEAEERLHEEKQRAENAEIAKKIGEQFLATMSHEIRTPMNAIVGFTDVISKTPLTSEQQQYLQAIKMSGENLLVIINDILDFSRMKSGKLPIENREFKLSQVVAMVTQLMELKASNKGIFLSTNVDENIPDNLIGDPTRLNQILLNLVANAIKFTSKGGVTINIKLLSEIKNTVNIEFAVSDTGIGIPEEKLSSVFEPFVQADNNTARKYGGTGLGLAIVKQLVELQGGSIAVTSENGKGSCFYFQINYLKNNEPLSQKIIAREMIKEFDRKLNILLVEDNTMNQLLAKKVLEDWDWNVDIAENGVEAIKKLLLKEFDIILMDIQMPEMDGHEATWQIRNKMAAPVSNIPIIAMTAHVMPAEEDKCYEMGMNGYISKPFDTKTLYDKIISLINT